MLVGAASVHLDSSLRVPSCKLRPTSYYPLAIGSALLQPQRGVWSHGNRAVVPGLMLATKDWASQGRRETRGWQRNIPR